MIRVVHYFSSYQPHIASLLHNYTGLSHFITHGSIIVIFFSKEIIVCTLSKENLNVVIKLQTLQDEH